jgi:hypothetical protein
MNKGEGRVSWRILVRRWCRRRVQVRAAVFVCVMAVSGALGGGVLAQVSGEQEAVTVTVVHGRVLQAVTKEPVARALVTTGGDEYATMTDDRGQFEIKITEQTVTVRNGMGASGTVTIQPPRSGPFVARKPGFLPPGRDSGMALTTGKSSDVTIYVVPEALIVGRVEVPGTEGEVRIQCELYKRNMREGREEWSPAGRFTTWSNGEFRFSDLQAGTYKLITHEQMDRDSQFAVPGAPLFGYPPMYYPNTTDFSAASPITVKAGATAQVNLTVARQAYYPVRIPVANAPGRPMNLMVYPSGHRSPGWSLGYNPMDGAIEGMLPNGNYTVEADAIGESAGITNFSVRGRPAMGAPLQLVENPSITVDIHEEFKSTEPDAAIGMSGPNDEQTVMRANVTLAPLEEMRGLGTAMAQPAPGSRGRILTLRNVRPGSYRVTVVPGAGYAASIESGGVDLLRQPLVVRIGGGTSPIEVTLRDDGGEVSGTVRSSEQNAANAQLARFVYVLPADAGGGQLGQSATWSGDNFYVDQVAPGNYLVVVFDQRQDELAYGSEEALRSLEGKGKMVHVEAEQKVHVDLKVIEGSEMQ